MVWGLDPIPGTEPKQSGSESVEFQPLDYQGVPCVYF